MGVDDRDEGYMNDKRIAKVSEDVWSCNGWVKGHALQSM